MESMFLMAVLFAPPSCPNGQCQITPASAVVQSAPVPAKTAVTHRGPVARFFAGISARRAERRTTRTIGGCPNVGTIRRR